MKNSIKEKWFGISDFGKEDLKYEKWELCIADDVSPKPHVKEILKRCLSGTG